jgi:PAS domain S-box-containing protein
MDDLELLAEVSQMLTLLDANQVFEKVIDLTARAVGGSKATLFLQRQHSGWERILGPADERRERSLHVVKSVLENGLAGWVLRNREAAVVQDTQTDERWHVLPGDDNPVRSAVCVPMMYDDQMLGVLTLDHPEPNHFTERDLRLLTIVANQASAAVRNALLVGQIQDQSYQLAAVLHALPDVLLVLDDSGCILLTNDSAAGLFGGLTPGELIDRQLSEFAAQEPALASIQAILDSPDREQQQWIFETRSERTRQDFLVTMSVWHSTSAAPKNSIGNGSLAGYVIILHDITTLRDLNRFKDVMLKIVSHDLRSPLALIVGYCDIIEMDVPPESPVHEYLDIVRKATERMTGLLDGLLRVEAIRKSAQELVENIDFRVLVEMVMDDGRTMASQKDLKLAMDVHLHDVPQITAQPMLLREAMTNLVSNAIKYTRSGGQILVQAYYESDKIHFVVEDNGIGIAADEVSRVFDPLYRAKRKDGERIEGKGLGLSLVKSIIERHHGEVWVESEEDKGSRFGFWLPLS